MFRRKAAAPPRSKTARGPARSTSAAPPTSRAPAPKTSRAAPAPKTSRAGPLKTARRPTVSNEAASENIRVCVRFRPTKRGEDSNDQLDIVENTVGVANPKREFVLDRIFTDESTQEEVFDWAAKNSLVDPLHGINVTILAYGQTGAGKTHTMFGKIEEEELRGIIPRCCTLLFELMEEDEQGVEFTCQCSMLEIYREELYDLLAEQRSEAPLQIKESRDGSVEVENLSREYVTDAEQVLGLIDFGNKMKVVAATQMNKESSRSHTIVVLDIVMKDKNGGTNKGRLNLVDLAGSEKVKKTGAAGQTLEEAKKINLSLTALSHCIYALCKNDPHIPFRSSKLTRFLQNSLGGNSKTTLVVACGSELSSMAETLSSLEFATRAKKIKNKVSVNVQMSVEDLQEKLKAAEFELDTLKRYVQELEGLAAANSLSMPSRPDLNLGDPIAPANGGAGGANGGPPRAGYGVGGDGLLSPNAGQHLLSPHGYQDSMGFGDFAPASERGRALSDSGLDNLGDRLEVIASSWTREKAMDHANFLAQVPDVGLLGEESGLVVEEDDNDPLTQLVNKQAEIDALTEEIETVYALVLAHESDMAKFIESKNLEVNSLRALLEQYGFSAGHQHPVSQPGFLNTKPGQQLMGQASYHEFQQQQPLVALEANSGVSGNMDHLQHRIAEQNQALQQQQGVLVKQQDILSLQQDRIRELEIMAEEYERQLKDEQKQRDAIQARNNELELEVAKFKRALRSSLSRGGSFSVAAQDIASMAQRRSSLGVPGSGGALGGVLAPPEMELIRAASDLASLGKHPHSKIVKPIRPTAQRQASLRVKQLTVGLVAEGSGSENGSPEGKQRPVDNAPAQRKASMPVPQLVLEKVGSGKGFPGIPNVESGSDSDSDSNGPDEEGM